MEHLYEKLTAYGNSDYYAFHMPGHKRNPLTVDSDFPVERDITEINGFDNLHHAEDILKRAQEDVARIYGVQESFYSINGSSGAILAAVSAAVKKGGHILVARNCHKAVYHGIYLWDLEATYIYPPEHPKLGKNGGISPSRVEMYLEEKKDIEAVLITSPTYDGIVSDIARIADIAHNHGVPLIVDEAHGAHFCFSDYFPVSAAQLGADVVGDEAEWASQKKRNAPAPLNNGGLGQNHFQHKGHRGARQQARGRRCGDERAIAAALLRRGVLGQKHGGTRVLASH